MWDVCGWYELWGGWRAGSGDLHVTPGGASAAREAAHALGSAHVASKAEELRQTGSEVREVW